MIGRTAHVRGVFDAPCACRDALRRQRRRGAFDRVRERSGAGVVARREQFAQACGCVGIARAEIGDQAP